MPRVQTIVYRNGRVLLVRHRAAGKEHWCLPGGAQLAGECPEAGALRELAEECNVQGVVVRQTSHVAGALGDETLTFLVDIGEQEPTLGRDPELADDEAVLTDLAWLALDEIAERDRVYLWAAGALGVGDFLKDVQTWGDVISYPGNDRCPAFGQRLAGVDYVERPGSYAIIQDEDGRVAAVESGTDLHLPGGGREPGETDVESLQRECREECGLAIEVLDRIGRAIQYGISRQGEPIAKACDYFRARVLASEPGEVPAKGERLRWVTVDEATQCLAHEAHAWALRRATTSCRH
ncbi:MAG: RNA pyrophosphohydrolase [Phycisphaerae bacterium]|nr:RNA pyrophosphohydrolase [Phycisphaerae bacterium]